MLSAEVMGGDSLQSLEAGFDLSVERNVNATVSELCECKDCCLDVVEFVSEHELVVCSQGSGVECGNVDGPRSELRVCHNAVRPLHEGGPETAGKQGLLYCLRVELIDLADPEINILLHLVSLDEDCKQLPLVASHNSAHRSAYRRGEENVLRHLVCQDRTSCEDLVALLDQELRSEVPEIRRSDCDNIRKYGLPDGPDCRTCERNVQPFS